MNRYNTATATLIAQWESSPYADDLKRIEETLYRTGDNDHFLVSNRGWILAEAEYHGESVQDGVAMLPIDYDRALDWARDHAPPAKLQQFFGG